MFERGHPPYIGPGRPKGSLNKTTVEAKSLARQLIDDSLYRKNLLNRLQQGEAGQMEVVLWHYAYGKPKEAVEVDYHLERLSNEEFDQLETLIKRIQ